VHRLTEAIIVPEVGVELVVVACMNIHSAPAGVRLAPGYNWLLDAAF
jgi:hypothetical protein